MDYKEIFNEDYSKIVKKVESKKDLSSYKKLLRIFKIIFNKHINVTDYELWLFCKLSYSNEGVLQEFINSYLNSKYEIKQYISESNGLQFYVILSKLTQDLVIAFRGTDEWVDWLTNIQILKQKSRQFETAKLYLENLFIKYKSYNIYMCGHSLGGALAQQMYVEFYNFTKIKLIKVVTFNSAGVRTKKEKTYSNLPITNYIIDNDIVGCSTGYHYGKNIYLKPIQINKGIDILKLYTHALDQFKFSDNGNIINEDIINVEKQVI